MLKIRSTSAASFITIRTEQIANIVYNEDGRNHYEFKINDKTMDAYREYRAKINNKRSLYKNLSEFIESELSIDKNVFNMQFDAYKKAIKGG